MFREEVVSIIQSLYNKTIVHDFVLKKAVERPAKADFGMRYIYREFSSEYAELFNRELNDISTI